MTRETSWTSTPGTCYKENSRPHDPCTFLFKPSLPIERTFRRRPRTRPHTEPPDPLVLSMDLRFLFVASALVLGATITMLLAEETEQCKVKWLFGISCSEVNEKLVSQIKAWQSRPSCLAAGERCSYELVSSAPYMIQATHMSPKTKKVNDLQFLLEQSTVCKMSGDAVSEVSKDPADNNTNYCSLQNLMDGSGLIDAEGYKQFSNKWICPGFDTADCTFS
ncbi:uncharacterized protein wu:fc46h12 isoform X1 [Platichthys flesus]|uniref:uncharacterized protein wu:fc46h12 isoform X1 n=2 Tax=Platichthys flesus TaxID=8260 RepID=UPI002DBC38D0|nr:uncharacterized protein wu:fc46h12 isoform X1 [Platichthys flesus]